MPLINSLYSQPFIFLKDLNMAFIELFMDLLEVRVPWVWSSDLGHIGTKNKLLLDILTKVDATHYLTGNGAKDYLNESLFTESGIAVEWQSFTHPIYSQQFGEFEPNLSVIDLLFNCGIEKSKIFLKGSK